MNSADGIRVSFETQFNADTQTKYLAVCGSLDVLGNWEVERAVVADESPENSGKWIVTVNLPANVKFEWKWVVVWRENHTAFRWEERANRVTEVGKESCKCHAPWNEDTTYKTLPQVSDGVMWTSEDDGHVEKLADDPVPDDPQGYPIVGSISSYIRDIGFLISWSVQSIKNGVVAIFQRIGGVFRGGRANDHDD